ncbi:MAG TPA: DUF1573 domain-containing protein [Candidatus Anammoximicrobium sp.]|nr:DUF1573 domain-containing protein [Candidatus Anammoximicrobium sp.]
MKPLLFGALLWIAGTSQVAGQEWARKMFSETEHDFGTVPRGSKQEYAFRFKNLYKESVHVAGVYSHCGCTTPSIEKDTLATHETGEIRVRFNTKSFLGERGATITVTIDEPARAEVQLQVRGYIRSDVVFTPGTVDFGAVAAGDGGAAKLEVAYAGSDDWEIVDVLSANQFLEVDLDETTRSRGQVGYHMLVHLKPGAPAGVLQDQLAIVTNEGDGKVLLLPVEGHVTSPLTVSPAALFLGTMKPGETVKKRLVVRGSKPFRILKVQCDDPRCVFDAVADEAKSLHFVTLAFAASGETGEISKVIRIQTDLGSGLCGECTVRGTVQSGP